MAQYKCKDCGFEAGKKFSNGQCPACDSFNIANRHQTKTEDKPSSRLTLAFTLGLWGLLAFLVWGKISG